MGRFLTICLAGALLAGCTALGVYDEHAVARAQQEMLGQPRSAVYNCVGNPDERVVKDGEERLIYRTKRTLDYQGDDVTETCQATFVIKDGTVADLIYDWDKQKSVTEGGACRGIIKYCLD